MWQKHFENAIFFHLRRTYRNLYYFQERRECDFPVEEANTVTQAIQVCAELNQDDQEREINGLLEALSSFGLDREVIVTLNQEDTLQQAGKYMALVPTRKWFIRADYEG